MRPQHCFYKENSGMNKSRRIDYINIRNYPLLCLLLFSLISIPILASGDPSEDNSQIENSDSTRGRLKPFDNSTPQGEHTVVAMRIMLSPELRLSAASLPGSCVDLYERLYDPKKAVIFRRKRATDILLISMNKNDLLSGRQMISASFLIKPETAENLLGGLRPKIELYLASSAAARGTMAFKPCSN